MEIKHFMFWLPMIVLAFANATLRELVFIKHYSELRAHQLSTLTLIVFCSLYVWFVFPLLSIHHAKQALLVGFVWVLLTVAFEFGLGRSTKRSWEYLLRDYNMLEGHIWILFLVSLFLLPFACFVIRNR